METQYEVLLFVTVAVLGYLGGIRKAKSTCCCCSVEVERDSESNALESIKVVRKQRSVVNSEV